MSNGLWIGIALFAMGIGTGLVVVVVDGLRRLKWMKKGIVWFSDRRALVLLFEEWCVQNDTAKNCFNLVGFLMLKGLLDADAANKYVVEQRKKEGRNVVDRKRAD